MTFRTVPLVITPTPEDAAAHARATAALAARLQRHADRERRVVSGMASSMTVDCVLRNKHLSRVLAGPVPLYKGK